MSTIHHESQSIVILAYNQAPIRALTYRVKQWTGRKTNVEYIPPPWKSIYLSFGGDMWLSRSQASCLLRPLVGGDSHTRQEVTIQIQTEESIKHLIQFRMLCEPFPLDSFEQRINNCILTESCPYRYGGYGTVGLLTLYQWKSCYYVYNKF